MPEYDPDFGNNGFLEFTNGVEHISKLKVLSDGKFYIMALYYPDQTPGNRIYYAYISRHLPDGSYDTSFGTGGMTVLYDYPRSFFSDFVLLPDQSVIAAFVQSVNWVYERSVVKLTPDGQLDTSFGANGFVNFGNGTITFQPNGKLLVSDINEQTGNTLVRRLLLDGSLDMSFGTQGVTEFVTPDTEEYVYQISILQNGDILYLVTNLGNAYIAKTDADGHIIDAFGNHGILDVQTPPDNREGILRFLLTEQEDIVLTGSQEISTGDMFGAGESMLVKYRADGSLDTTFGNAGYIITDLTSGNSYGETAILQPDGKIIQFIKSGYPMSASNGEDAYEGLARFLPDGRLDMSFGTDGYFMQYYYSWQTFVFYDMQWHQGNNLLLVGVKGTSRHHGLIARIKNLYNTAAVSDSQDLSLRLYPNPAHNFLHIQSKLPVSQISIYTAAGRFIRQAEQTDIVNVSNLPTGIYLLYIETEKGRIIKKFVKR